MYFSTSNSKWVIVTTLIFALLLMIIPLPNWLQVVRPQWFLLVLIYWSLTLPNKVGIFTAWAGGLLLDVLQNTLFGEHALIFTIVIYLVLRFRTRINFFPFWQKTAVILGLISLNQCLYFWLNEILSSQIRSTLYWASILTTLLFWPWTAAFLRYLQMRFNVR